jgi:hypothetical protein
MIFNHQQKMVKTNIFWTIKIFLFFLFLLDLIKFVLALQQQHSTKIAQMDQMHSNALKQLEMQLIQQQNTIDRDSP